MFYTYFLYINIIIVFIIHVFLIILTCVTGASICWSQNGVLVIQSWLGNSRKPGFPSATTYSLYQREILVLFMYFTHHKYISCPRTQCVQKSVKPDMETFLPDCPDLHFALDCVQFLTKHTFCGLLKILPGDLGSEFARGYTRECG